MKRFVTAVVVAGLLIATTASGAVAKTTKTEATGTATTTGMIPGTETWVGSVQSVRGLVLLQDGVWDSDYLTGPQVVTINWDIDYAHGPRRDVGQRTPRRDSGGRRGLGLHGSTRAIVDLVVTGKCVCQGTGTLHTWQWRADMHMVWNTPGNEFTGYFFQPGH